MLELEPRRRHFRELPGPKDENCFKIGHNRPSGSWADPHGLGSGAPAEVILHPTLLCGVLHS